MNTQINITGTYSGGVLTLPYIPLRGNKQNGARGILTMLLQLFTLPQFYPENYDSTDSNIIFTTQVLKQNHNKILLHFHPIGFLFMI